MAAPPVVPKPQPAAHLVIDGTFTPGRIINLYQEWPDDEAESDVAS